MFALQKCGLLEPTALLIRNLKLKKRLAFALQGNSALGAPDAAYLSVGHCRMRETLCQEAAPNAINKEAARARIN